MLRFDDCMKLQLGLCLLDNSVFAEPAYTWLLLSTGHTWLKGRRWRQDLVRVCGQGWQALAAGPSSLKGPQGGCTQVQESWTSVCSSGAPEEQVPHSGGLSGLPIKMVQSSTAAYLCTLLRSLSLHMKIRPNCCLLMQQLAVLGPVGLPIKTLQAHLLLNGKCHWVHSEHLVAHLWYVSCCQKFLYKKI